MGSRVVGTFGPSRMGGPMSTQTCPSCSKEGCITPAMQTLSGVKSCTLSFAHVHFCCRHVCCENFGRLGDIL